MKILICLCCSFICLPAFSQKLFGTVFNSQGDLLPYSSITIKGTNKGTSANDKGKYAVNLEAGKYTVVCQHLGYTAQQKEITVNGNTELSFILNEQKLTLDAVVVKAGAEDPAYEIIRNAIKKRNFYDAQVKAFTCNIYGKDLIRLRNLPKRILGQKIPDADRKEMGLDSTGQGIIYLSESISKVSTQEPDKFKLEVISSRVSGSGGFGFNFPAFISLYKNNVTVFTEKFNPRGFVSPIADGAIGFYKFKYLGTFVENGKIINSIRVTPRRKYEPLFSGTINISDDDWRIHSFDLVLTKTSQLEIMDSLQITQLHSPVSGEVWRVKSQLLHFNFKQLGINAGGNFLTVYSDYNINPTYPKKFFDNVVIKYDTGVNKRPVSYWDSARAVPLEPEEQLDFKTKDSVYKSNKDSLLSRRSLDSLNKNQPKIKLTDPFLKGVRRTHFTGTKINSFGFEGLIPNAEYNPAEGAVLNVKGFFTTFTRKTRSFVSFNPTIRYGFHNQHLNAFATLTFRNRDLDSSSGVIKRYAISFSGGKRVSDFNADNPFPPFRNSISTLLFGRNYLKTYENYYGDITLNKRYENGLRLTLSGLFEDRIPLNNTTNFVFIKKYRDRITPNYPYERIPAQFEPHRAFLLAAVIRFKPGQKYIQLPNNKIPIGSKYPELTLSYVKGIEKIFGSDENFDKWKFTVSDDKNLKLAGTLKYKFGIGGFLNDKKVFIQDFQHFNGNRAVAASAYVNSFQLAPYYKYSTTASFYALGHLEHHFNGLLTNKIPLFRKLNWNLVGGSNAFYVNSNNHYVEIFGGLENILKIFRVDFVAGYESNGKINTGIRIGGGGLLGGSITRDNNSVSIGF